MDKTLFNKFFPEADPEAPLQVSYQSKVIVEDGVILDTMPKFTNPSIFSSDNLRCSTLEFRLKEEYNQLGMYAFVSWQWVNPFVKWIGQKRCLEVMAGRGWLSYALRQKGVDIISTDDFSWSKKRGWSSPLTEIEELDAVESVRKYGKEIDILIISWPYMNDSAFRVIRELYEVNPFAKVVYIGEGWGGCTADDDFFEHFEEIEDPSFEIVTSNFQSWWGIRDYPQLGRFRRIQC